MKEQDVDLIADGHPRRMPRSAADRRPTLGVCRGLLGQDILALVKNAAPAAVISAALSVAAPAIPTIESATDRCEAIGPTQCAVRAPHPADNRDLEVENPLVNSGASSIGPPATYRPTIGGSITVTGNTLARNYVPPSVPRSGGGH
jgi:hypothetical protein